MGGLNVAVTGLNATDNPGPGVAVIRGIKDAEEFDGQIIGLAYDALEPGNFAAELVDGVFIIPYPSQGPEALLSRLEEIQERARIDVLIPTLDAELDSFIALEAPLRDLGIRMFLPSKSQLELRSKSVLERTGTEAGLRIPKARAVQDVRELYSIHEEIPYPFYVKGAFYGAKRAHSVDEAVRAYHATVARWGLPVIVQELVDGDELNVLALGDGRGGLVGAVSMRKTFITELGKGWAGITIRDPELLNIAEKFMAAVKWRGACEIEIIKTRDERYYVLEINPRFPAWSYLSTGAGMNLPYAAVKLSAGEEVAPMRDYRVGTMFVRISLDQIASLDDFQQLATRGELWHRTQEEAA